MSSYEITVMRLKCLCALALCAGLAFAPDGFMRLRAQTPPAPADKPKFEVASVRENTNNDGKIMLGIQPGGRFNAVNVPLWDLIRQAHAVQRSQLVGAPDWTETARFDIVAKAEGDIAPAPPGSPAGPLSFMLQERFKLRTHRETREMPIYTLTVARSDRQLGAGLRPSTTDCAAMRGRGRGGVGVAPGAPPQGPPPAGQRPLCGMRMAPNQLIAGGVPLAQLTQVLSQLTQRV